MLILPTCDPGSGAKPRAAAFKCSQLALAVPGAQVPQELAVDNWQADPQGAQGLFSGQRTLRESAGSILCSA